MFVGGTPARLGRIGLAAALVLVMAAALAPAARGNGGAAACRGVRCSGHGSCIAEGDRAMCFCDEGFAADGLECEPAPLPRHAWANRRQAWSGPRVVDVAVAEVGKTGRNVGSTLRQPPYGMRHYVPVGDQWCTDFVSWAYRVAGVPVTGGSHGGWMIGNNVAMRAWFERYDLWVEPGSERWRRLEPQPGDWVRLHTRSGVGHSAIVRFTRGGDLYTVEGNVTNHVRLRRHRDWRDNPRLAGIGLLMRPPARGR